MLTREKATDYLETHATPDEDIPGPILVLPTIDSTESSSLPLGRYGLAIRVDSHEIGDDESSSGLSTPIINPFEIEQPQVYEPEDTPISESPKDVEGEDVWEYPKTLITRPSDSTTDPTGDLIGERAISEYYKFLYGAETEVDTKVAMSLEEHYFWTYTSRTLKRQPFPFPKEYINLLSHFVNFWNKTKGPWTVNNFCVYLGTVGEDPALEPETIGSIISEPLLLQALNFGQDLEQDLGQVLEDVFPSGNLAERSIHIQLGEILGAGLEVQPTDQIERHLDIKGRTVSIFRPNPQDMPMWLQYENNKVARALGLSSLWVETIATLRDLYGNKPDLTRRAVSQNLYPSEADGNIHMFTAALSANVPTPKFSLLAGKLEKLEATISQDDIWW